MYIILILIQSFILFTLNLTTTLRPLVTLDTNYAKMTTRVKKTTLYMRTQMKRLKVYYTLMNLAEHYLPNLF